jgi:hypothetical protein
MRETGTNSRAKRVRQASNARVSREMRETWWVYGHALLITPDVTMAGAL